jgi:hypothetical protein
MSVESNQLRNSAQILALFQGSPASKLKTALITRLLYLGTNQSIPEFYPNDIHLARALQIESEEGHAFIFMGQVFSNYETSHSGLVYLFKRQEQTEMQAHRLWGIGNSSGEKVFGENLVGFAFSKTLNGGRDEPIALTETSGNLQIETFSYNGNNIGAFITEVTNPLQKIIAPRNAFISD